MVNNSLRMQYGFVISAIFYLLLNFFIEDSLLDWVGGIIALITIVFILNGLNFRNIN